MGLGVLAEHESGAKKRGRAESGCQKIKQELLERKRSG